MRIASYPSANAIPISARGLVGQSIPCALRPPPATRYTEHRGLALPRQVLCATDAKPPVTPPALQTRSGELLSFLGPNEWHPANMLPLTRDAAQDTFVGVGTERCWMAMALHPSMQAWYLVDRDPCVNFYNRLNLALLHASAGSREAYLSLRQARDPEAWRQAAKEVEGANKALLESHDAFVWWAAAQTFDGDPGALEFMRPGGDRFAGAQYCLDDALFAGVYAHIKRSAVHVAQVDLADKARVARFSQGLAQSGHKISVLDISNCWWKIYMSAEEVHALVAATQACAAPCAVLLMTQLQKVDRINAEFMFHAANLRDAAQFKLLFSEYMGSMGGLLWGECVDPGRPLVLATGVVWQRPSPQDASLRAA